MKTANTADTSQVPTEEQSSQAGEHPGRAPAWRDALAALVTIGFAALFAYAISMIPGEDFRRAEGIVYYPLLVCGLLLTASIALLVKSLMARQGNPEQVSEGSGEISGEADESAQGASTGFLRLLLGVAILAAYMAGLAMVGFILSTPVLVAALLLAYGVRDWKALLLLPLCTTGAVYLIFYYMLAVQLP